MDIKQMLAKDMAQAVDKREQVRRDFPECSAFADQVRAAFGPGVKAKFFSENGKTMGKPTPDEGMDAFRLLGMIDMVEFMKAGKKKSVDKGRGRP